MSEKKVFRSVTKKSSVVFPEMVNTFKRDGLSAMSIFKSMIPDDDSDITDEKIKEIAAAATAMASSAHSYLQMKKALKK
jgi:hypothetical protein